MAAEVQCQVSLPSGQAKAAFEERRATLQRLETLPVESRRQALDEYYDAWVENGCYDQDLTSGGYVAAGNLAREMAEWFPDKTKRILDCASGTGLLGDELQKRGFTNLDACDSSQGSLDFSKGKNVYQNFICAELGPDRLPIEDDTYDGICLTGGFGRGHVQPDCLPEWRRITTPGGLLMFVVREETLIRTEGFRNGALDAIVHNEAGKGSWEFLLKKRLPYLEVTKNVERKVAEYAAMYVIRVL